MKKLSIAIVLLFLGCSADEPKMTFQDEIPNEAQHQEPPPPEIQIPTVKRSVQLKKCNVYSDYKLNSEILSSVKHGENIATQEVGVHKFYKVLFVDSVEIGYVLKDCFKKKAPPKKRPSKAPKNKTVA
jgi:hypothetical protein